MDGRVSDALPETFAASFVDRWTFYECTALKIVFAASYNSVMPPLMSPPANHRCAPLGNHRPPRKENTNPRPVHKKKTQSNHLLVDNRTPHWTKNPTQREKEPPPPPPRGVVLIWGRGGGGLYPTTEGTFARHAGIRINFLAIYPNAFPPNITPSSSPGYLTPAISGARVWAGWLHYPCLLRDPQHGGKKRGERGTTGGK